MAVQSDAFVTTSYNAYLLHFSFLDIMETDSIEEWTQVSSSLSLNCLLLYSQEACERDWNHGIKMTNRHCFYCQPPKFQEQTESSV